MNSQLDKVIQKLKTKKKKMLCGFFVLTVTP